MSLAIVLKEAGGDLAPTSRASLFLYRVTAAWLVIGALHVIPLAADGWNWSGALSWRKPIVFSVSVGLLLATIGWIIDRIPIRGRIASALGWTLAVSSSIEVALITFQTWRGRASHFNVMESTDATVFTLMGAAVGVMSLCIVTVFAWSLFRRPTDRLIRIAIISGLALVVTALGLGQWIIQLGVDYVERFNTVPDTVTVGRAGVAKFPHALALHGIQLFIAYALVLRRTPKSDSRVAKLYGLILLYFGVVGLVVAQTVAGYAPTDITAFSVGSALLVVAVVAVLIAALRDRLRTVHESGAVEPVDMLSR